MTALPLMYLDSPNSELWKYQDNGDVFVWSDTGETIMLASNAAALCKVLLRELNGLPSLTAILFISDALSKGWSTTLASKRVAILKRSVQDNKGHSDPKSHSHVVDWLESLGQLSTDLRKGIHAQSAFLAEIWEKFPHQWLEIEQSDSEFAIQWLSIPANERSNSELSSVDVSSYRSKKTLQALEYASLLTIDEKSIRHRLKTGIDFVTDLSTPEEPVELKDPINQLLNQLYKNAHNSVQGFVASLAWEASSLISLPRKPSEPDDLQIGGVSDISNRGNPERLLMTELAADPDLLIARIANGQALYLRRESPPKPRPQTRDILIENGIRCWGEQRLTILAFALAAAASEEKRGTQVSITTLAGQELFDENFSTFEGLTEALERLHYSNHPGQALEHLIQKHEREKQPISEPLLIVTSATSNDPMFWEKAKRLPTPYLLAVVKPERWIEIREQTSRGSAVWKRLQLTPPKRAKTKVESSEVPQFVKLICSPLRFICDLNVPFVHAFENGKTPGAWLITKQYRLLYFDRSGFGCLDLGSVPTDNVLTATTPSRDSIMMVLERNGRSESELVHYLVKASLKDGIKCQQIEPTVDSPRAAKYCFDQGNLWRIGNKLDVIDLSNGRVIARSDKRQRHLGGPFFGDRDLILASFIDNAIVWYHIGKCNFPIGFVLRSGTAPFAVAADFSWTKSFTGSSESEVSTGRKVISTMPPELVRISHDRTEALATISRVSKSIGFDSTEPEASNLAISVSLKNSAISRSRLSPTEAIRSFERADLSLPIGHSVSSRFNFVGFHHDGLLLARNRSKVSILCADNSRFRLELCKDQGLSEVMVPFSDDIPQEQEPIKRRWRLNRADLGQCTIWLDSRGLLHLRDSDGVELSLMLAQSTMAGWFSKGEVFGPTYFTSKEASQPSQVVCDWYKRFLEQCYR